MSDLGFNDRDFAVVEKIIHRPNGIFLVTGPTGSVVIATPDVPLITMGDIRAHEIILCGEDGADNIDDVYSWVMNNFWETNFKVSLGGFHQFRYSLINLFGSF